MGRVNGGREGDSLFFPKEVVTVGKMNRITRLLRVAPKAAGVRQMGGAAPAHWKPLKQVMIDNKAHMDFLPVPAGSWAEYNAAVNAKYNKFIAIGVIANIVTYSIIGSMGYLEIIWGPKMTNPPPAEWFNEDGSWKTS